MTLGDAKDKVIKLIDEYSQNGQPVDATGGGRLDYSYKFPQFFDLAQKQTAQIQPIKRALNIAHYPQENLLGSNMDVFEKSGDEIFESDGACSAAFECDGVCDAYLQRKQSGVWSTCASIECRPVGSFAGFTKYSASAPGSGRLRLLITGNERCLIRNVAMFTGNTAGDFAEWVFYTLPDDFVKSLDVRGKRGRAAFSVIDNKIGFRYAEQDVYSVEYAARPRTIESHTPDSYVFEVTEEAAQALPYLVAAQCVMLEDENAYVRFTNLAQTVFATLSEQITHNDSGEVKNTFFGG